MAAVPRCANPQRNVVPKSQFKKVRMSLLASNESLPTEEGIVGGDNDNDSEYHNNDYRYIYIYNVYIYIMYIYI